MPQTVVVLDFDETLGYFRPDITFLRLVAHALNEDPNVKNLKLEQKQCILQEVSRYLVRKSLRPGLIDFLKQLNHLKQEKWIERVEVHSIAGIPHPGTLLDILQTSPQKLLLDSILSEHGGLSCSLIDRIVLTKCKDIRDLPGSVFVVDDQPWKDNYKVDIKRTYGYQIYPYVINYYDLSTKSDLSKRWMRVFKHILTKNELELHPKSYTRYSHSFENQWKTRLFQEWTRAQKFALVQRERARKDEFHHILVQLVQCTNNIKKEESCIANKKRKHR